MPLWPARLVLRAQGADVRLPRRALRQLSCVLVLVGLALVVLLASDGGRSPAAAFPTLGLLGAKRPPYVVGRAAAGVLQGTKEFDWRGRELWNFPDRLLPEERYVVSGLHSGWTNQVMIVVNVIHLAMLTGRTPLLPPFLADPTRLGPIVREHMADLPFQEVFDLPRLFDALRQTPLGRDLRGIVDVSEVMEVGRAERAGGRGWPYDLFPPPADPDSVEIGALPFRAVPAPVNGSASFGAEAQHIDRKTETWDIGCWGHMPASDGVLRTFRSMRLAPDFTELPPPALEKTTRPFLRWDGLQAFLAAEPDASLVDEALGLMPDEWRPDLPPNAWVACMSSLYYAVAEAAQGVFVPYSTAPRLTPADLEAAPAVGPDAPVPWETVAQHMHWHPQLEERGRVVARRMFGLEEGAELPPFISVHIRHGDFMTKCRPKPGNTCFSLGAYAYAVAEMRQRLLDEQGVDAQRVLFTTNERDPAFLESARKLGWNRITDEEELRIRHDYGDWYPTLIDNVLLSMGAGIVGTVQSTMSLLNARRVEYWHGGLSTHIWYTAPVLDLD